MDKTTITLSPGFPTLLTVLFVALKLLKIIAWSWWWVLSPIWIPLGLGVVILLIALAIAALVE